MISIREFEAKPRAYVDRAARGETIVIADDDKPVAELRPHPAIDLGDDRLNALVREGKVIPPDRPLVLPEVGASAPPVTDRLLELARQGRVVLPTRPPFIPVLTGATMPPGQSLTDILLEERRDDRPLRHLG
jgi:antitoxin (DNA-binding transcriptional repressor) of toxin-antitoxin stability system